ncbi:PEP-utilizing enzyme [Miltoncostaea marina]|uniref:PEP-utilizing enzyme n=1 Tax=Miltoncostaea marina TaxID=2843215 RepID=UPI001C3E44A8|nr:PEP-utilizing enzyme [Miltoncostaea marina]
MTSAAPSAPFPVAWRSADESSLTWARDPMHFPGPVTAMTASLIEGPFTDGLVEAFEVMQAPVRGMVHRVFSSHVYSTAPPAEPPERMEERLGRHRRLMGDMMDGLRERWETEHLPAVEAIRRELDGLSFADAAADLDRVATLMRDSSRIHFLVVIPRVASGERFATLYAQATGSDNEMEPYRCLLGEPNKSLETDRALWDLARRAAADGAVAAALRAGGPAEVMEALGATAGGRAWRAAFDAAMREYGHRGQAIEMAAPTWLEDPSFALDNVRRYLDGDALDPEGARAEHLAERERLVAAARARIAGDAEALAAFDHALATARANWPLEEDHAFHIDQRLWGSAVRRALLRLGDRLVDAGRLEARDDVFHLTLDEARAAAGGADARGPAREGRRRMADDALLDPPPTVGAPPDPSQHMDPGMVKFFGRPGPPQVDGGVLRGSPGSAGRAEGVARVVTSVEGLAAVLPGEILVCRSTTPPWTPVFASIAGLVTETGGVLAHGAIVAREYGIPAVMGTKIATSMIRDGQRVVVDGDAGEVRIAG